MTLFSPSQPIGIFDSGIGGLTVAHVLTQQLPNENIIYFGDTAHMPWGNKSATTIQSYSIKIADLLLEHHCKLILIACNTASTLAESIKKHIDKRAIVINVIDPLVQQLKEGHANQRIGLIGTRQTVASNVYKQKIAALNNNIQLHSVATNLLASAIEEFGNHNILDSLLDVYLSHPTLIDLDSLILACTHYPVIKEKIAAFFNYQIEIIDPAHAVAVTVKKELEQHHLINLHGQGEKHFYVSEYTESFAAGAKIFFSEAIKLEHHPLWD